MQVRPTSKRIPSAEPRPVVSRPVAIPIGRSVLPADRRPAIVGSGAAAARVGQADAAARKTAKNARRMLDSTIVRPRLVVGRAAAMQPKSADESATEMTEIVLPSDGNVLGSAFGGKVMQWIDIC